MLGSYFNVFILLCLQQFSEGFNQAHLRVKFPLHGLLGHGFLKCIKNIIGHSFLCDFLNKIPYNATNTSQKC